MFVLIPIARNKRKYLLNFDGNLLELTYIAQWTRHLGMAYGLCIFCYTLFTNEYIAQMNFVTAEILRKVTLEIP